MRWQRSSVPAGATEERDELLLLCISQSHLEAIVAKIDDFRERRRRAVSPE
jgi:hypothetical protein